jgi:hypothetical protein
MCGTYNLQTIPPTFANKTNNEEKYMRLQSITKAFTIAFAVFMLATMSFGQTTFPGTGVGAIADSTACGPTPGTPLNITFNVSGISGNVSNLSVDTTFGSPNHTWMGDVVTTIIAPNATQFTVFGQTTSTTATGIGDSSDLGGLYTFNNAATGNWWTAATTAAAAAVIPPGSYRTAQLGGAGATNAATDMNAAFATTPANGTWTLRVTDGCTGDTGAITAAALTITGAATAPNNAPNDTNGDGKTDFQVVRGGVPAAGQVSWYNKDVVSGATTGFSWGSDTDFFVMEDFDGDGKDDITVWRPGAPTVASFYILNSNGFTLNQQVFGQTGDTPDVVGDWDGDNKADVAVYRDGTAASPASFFYYRGSMGNPSGATTYIPWGVDGDFGYALDYDGDGKLDPVVQRNGGGGRGDHYIRQSSNSALVYVIYGLSTDFIVPGDYDGDGKDDIAVSRNANFGAGTFKYFWIRETDGGGTPNAPVEWGVAGDFICQGDYDGDGKTDIAVWRPSADPAQNFYHVRMSSTSALMSVEWGQMGDYPVNNWNVH